MRSPSSVSAAGASSSRTIVTSTRIAAASPMPVIRMVGSGSVAKPRKTATMIAPAAVITRLVRPTAAAIMVAVFLGFASEVDWTVKQLGIGMAVAVLLDATLVRMVLVPATMSLLGRWNWWLPGWLDRLLPTVSVEDDAADLEPADA